MWKSVCQIFRRYLWSGVNFTNILRDAYVTVDSNVHLGTWQWTNGVKYWASIKVLLELAILLSVQVVCQKLGAFYKRVGKIDPLSKSINAPLHSIWPKKCQSVSPRELCETPNMHKTLSYGQMKRYFFVKGCSHNEIQLNSKVYSYFVSIYINPGGNAIKKFYS